MNFLFSLCAVSGPVIVFSPVAENTYLILFLLLTSILVAWVLASRRAILDHDEEAGHPTPLRTYGTSIGNHELVLEAPEDRLHHRTELL